MQNVLDNCLIEKEFKKIHWDNININNNLEEDMILTQVANSILKLSFKQRTPLKTI